MTKHNHPREVEAKDMYGGEVTTITVSLIEGRGQRKRTCQQIVCWDPEPLNQKSFED